MINILISFLTFVLILVSLFMVLVILMQRANTNAGMGSAFGGGVTESAFGAETTNILTRATKWSAFVFFIIALVLYLLYMSRDKFVQGPSDTDIPNIPVATETVDFPMVPENAQDLPEQAPVETTEADTAPSTAEETTPPSP